MLEKQYLYNQLANTRVIDKLRATDSPPEKAIILISHILNSHQTWLNRIVPESAPANPYGIWEILPIENMEPLNQENLRRTLALVESSETENLLENEISYKNTKGEAFVNKALDILNHVLLHSAYHRGQVAMNLRENDITPVATDYILYLRDAL